MALPFGWYALGNYIICFPFKTKCSMFLISYIRKPPHPQPFTFIEYVLYTQSYGNDEKENAITVRVKQCLTALNGMIYLWKES